MAPQNQLGAAPPPAGPVVLTPAQAAVLAGKPSTTLTREQNDIYRAGDRVTLTDAQVAAVNANPKTVLTAAQLSPAAPEKSPQETLEDICGDFIPSATRRTAFLNALGAVFGGSYKAPDTAPTDKNA
jgi:hypothetical protein